MDNLVTTATRPPEFLYPFSNYLLYKTLKMNSLLSKLNTIYLEHDYFMFKNVDIKLQTNK
jgi:hypothetical protein